ncbi:hypothetical protein C9374_001075 [Naegleria lovaniensis]|uniref:Uncharacterized protein n=1 Tax=Naegleria lovaniensis TaxID=51637 RepID=A0AA88KLT1_NAELO|nr:uncharacterized protein C9374_001075 [Naegleria lovaniensis]KAG2388225.1 hypothetical protein C9374_001075 [Naegleria lovaniensis]
MSNSTMMNHRHSTSTSSSSPNYSNHHHHHEDSTDDDCSPITTHSNTTTFRNFQKQPHSTSSPTMNSSSVLQSSHWKRVKFTTITLVIMTIVSSFIYFVKFLPKRGDFYLPLDEQVDTLTKDLDVLYRPMINIDENGVNKYVKPYDEQLSIFSTSAIQLVRKRRSLLKTINGQDRVHFSRHLSELEKIHNILQKQIVEYFDYERVWAGPSKSSTQFTENPFDSPVIPADKFVENYQFYKNEIIPKHEAYFLLKKVHPVKRELDIVSIWDNDYSETLSKVARQIVGETCWNKKLVLFGEHWHTFHQGGPRKVGAYQIGALKLLKKDFIFTDDINDPNLLDADIVYSYNPHRYREFIKKLVLGIRNGKVAPQTKVFIGPVIAHDLVRDHYSLLGDRVTHLAASQWVKDVDYGPKIGGKVKILVHPTPINTKIWSPSEKVNVFDKRDILFYDKNCYYKQEELLTTFKTLLNGYPDFKDATFHIVDYNKRYSENYFLSLLKEKIRFAIVCARTETQGVALEEVMSMNIPLFVIWTPMDFEVAHDPVVVPYFVPGMSGLISGHQNITTVFPTFMQKVMDNSFNPRRFVVELFNYFSNVVDFLNILCYGESRFEPKENYLSEVKRLTKTYVPDDDDELLKN